jgi:hypothetical protein
MRENVPRIGNSRLVIIHLLPDGLRKEPCKVKYLNIFFLLAAYLLIEAAIVDVWMLSCLFAA